MCKLDYIMNKRFLFKFRRSDFCWIFVVNICLNSVKTQLDGLIFTDGITKRRNAAKKKENTKTKPGWLQAIAKSSPERNKWGWEFYHDFVWFIVYFYNFAWKDYGDATMSKLLDMVKVVAFAVQEGRVAIHCHAGKKKKNTNISTRSINYS